MPQTSHTTNHPPSPAVGRAIVRGTAYSTIGNIALRVIDAVTAVVLLNALSIYEYGIYTLALAAYSFWTIFFMPAIQNVIISDASAARQNDFAYGRSLFSVYAYFLFLVSFVLWALFFFGDHIFSYWVDGNGTALSYVAWLFLLAPLETMLGLKIAILLDFGWGLFYKTLRSTLRFGLLVACFIFFPSIGIGVALLTLVFAMGCALLVVWIFYRREAWLVRVGTADVHRFWMRAVRTHGKWALVEDLSSSMLQNVQPFLIKYFLGAEAVALVTLASNLLSYAKSLFPVRDVLFPTLPQAHDRAQFARYVGKLMKYATVIYCAIAFASAVGAPIAVYLLFPKYIPALPIFYIILLSLPVFGIRSVAVPVFYALKAQRSLFFIIISRTILSTVLLVVLMWLFGIEGVALGMLLTGVITAVAYLTEIRRRLPAMRFSISDILSYDEEDRQIVGSIFGFIRRKLRILRV